MGIRFRCHHCEHELHVKDFQAGRRGRCPECRGRLRIPETDAEYSLEVDHESSSSANDLESASVAATAERDTRKEVANLRKRERTAPENAREDLLPPTRSPARPTAAKSQPVKSRADSQASQKQDKSTAIASTQGSLSSQNVDEAETRVASEASERPSDSSTRQPPQALLDSPQATWYVRPATGGQYGPADNKALSQWLHEHRIGRDALVWRDGWPEWRSAATVFEDYFGQQAAMPTPLPAPEGHAEPAPSRGDTATENLAEPQSLSERNRLARKRRKRRNYVISIAVLAVLMLILILALVVVLMRPQSTIAL